MQRFPNNYMSSQQCPQCIGKQNRHNANRIIIGYRFFQFAMVPGPLKTDQGQIMPNSMASIEKNNQHHPRTNGKTMMLNVTDCGLSQCESTANGENKTFPLPRNQPIT